MCHERSNMERENDRSNSRQNESPTYRRERPNALMRFLFKLPIYLYWGPFARLMARRCVLRLTTRGRKSGKPRRTCISFMPVDGNYIVFVSWGVIAHWYKNIQSDPRVRINVGAQTINAHAYLIESPEKRREMMLRMSERSDDCGPPKFVRPLTSKVQLFDYENEIRTAVEHAGEMPIVEIVPVGFEPLVANPERR